MTDDKKNQVYDIVENFIKKQRIYCGETIYQTDRVIENAYEFIHELCEVVGYEKLDEEI